MKCGHPAHLVFMKEQISTNCVSSEIVSPPLHFDNGASLHDERAKAVRKVPNLQIESYHTLCGGTLTPHCTTYRAVCEVFLFHM